MLDPGANPLSHAIEKNRAAKIEHIRFNCIVRTRLERVTGAGKFSEVMELNSVPPELSVGRPFACARLLTVIATTAAAGSTIRFSADTMMTMSSSRAKVSSLAVQGDTRPSVIGSAVHIACIGSTFILSPAALLRV